MGAFLRLLLASLRGRGSAITLKSIFKSGSTSSRSVASWLGARAKAGKGNRLIGLAKSLFDRSKSYSTAMLKWVSDNPMKSTIALEGTIMVLRAFVEDPDADLTDEERNNIRESMRASGSSILLDAVDRMNMNNSGYTQPINEDLSRIADEFFSDRTAMATGRPIQYMRDNAAGIQDKERAYYMSRIASLQRFLIDTSPSPAVFEAYATGLHFATQDVTYMSGGFANAIDKDLVDDADIKTAATYFNASIGYFIEQLKSQTVNDYFDFTTSMFTEDASDYKKTSMFDSKLGAELLTQNLVADYKAFEPEGFNADFFNSGDDDEAASKAHIAEMVAADSTIFSAVAAFVRGNSDLLKRALK